MRLDVLLRLAPSLDNHAYNRTGFWLNSGDPDLWLDAMLRCQALHGDQVSFYAVPPATSDIDGWEDDGGFRQGGLIGLTRSDFQLHRSIVATPLIPIELGGNANDEWGNRQDLWLPQGSVVEPLPGNDWLGEMFDSISSQSESNLAYNIESSDCRLEDTTWIWLPQIGLVALEAKDRLSVVDLLKTPTCVDTFRKWASPPVAPVLPDRISGFLVLGESTDHEPLNDLSHEIGHKSSELKDLLDELSKNDGSRKRDLRTRGKQWLLGKLDHWFGKVESEPKHQPTGSRTGKATSNGGITLQLYRMLADAIADQRNEQLQKLLDMIRSDPDKALQFAIPLFGEGGFRGLSFPGAKLLARNPNFSMNSLSGGGAADFWGIGYEYQQQLRESYIAMAHREAAAGRFRRAAYIHAHLLGDFSAAAGALEQGGFHREAAVLYRDKLRRPIDQARCLAAAGLFEQAAEIYEMLGDFMSCANVWEKAGRHDLADAAYQKVVDKFKREGKICEAALMLASKLRNREAAKLLLWGEWPGGRTAIDCAKLYFEMLAEDFQHDLTVAQLRAVVEVSKHQFPYELAKLLESLATSYPDNRIQEFAADNCRSAVAWTLSQQLPIPEADVVSILQRLDYGDALLRHDCSRYVRREQGIASRAIANPKSLRSNVVSMKLLETLKLPPSNYKIIQGLAVGFLAAYETDKGHRMRLFAPMQPAESNHAAGKLMPSTVELFISGLLASICEYGTGNSLHLFGMKSDAWVGPDAGFNFVDAAGGQWSFSTKVPAALQQCEKVICVSADAWYGVEYVNDALHLKSCGPESQYLRMIRLPKPVNEDPAYSPSSFLPTTSEFDGFEREVSMTRACFLESVDDVPVVAFENVVAWGFGHSSQRSIKVGGTVQCVALWPSGTRKRIAVGHSRGLDLIWPEPGNVKSVSADDQQPYQHVLWMQGGRLFAISDRELYRYHVTSREVRLSGICKLRSQAIISLLALTPGICGVSYKDGTIDCF